MKPQSFSQNHLADLRIAYFDRTLNYGDCSVSLPNDDLLTTDIISCIFLPYLNGLTNLLLMFIFTEFIQFAEEFCRGLYRLTHYSGPSRRRMVVFATDL